MMILCGNSNRIWHYLAGRYPGAVGLLVGPSYVSKVPIQDDWMPFALDNDAYLAWRDKTLWNVVAWREMIARVRQQHLTPLWAIVPDVLGDRKATLKNWQQYSPEIHGLGWKAGFAVQDGMTVNDVPTCADVVFVGGTDGWKFPNLPIWTERFPHVHCGRVNSPEMFESCERLGCKSIDGTGWFREPSRKDKLPAIRRFIEGYRNGTPKFL